LRLELALEHQPRRIVSRKLGANVFAVTRGLRVLLPDGNRQPRPDRPLGVLKFSRTDPAILDRRIDVGSIRRGPGDSGKTKRGVGRPRDRTGLLAVSHHVAIAQREPRLIEAVEILEDQDRDRLAEIERRSADGAEEVACVKFGNARSDARQILGSNDHGRFQGAAQTRQIERVTDVCVASVARMSMACEVFAGQPGSAEIRRVSFPRYEVELFGKGQTRHADRDAARGE